MTLKPLTPLTLTAFTPTYFPWSYLGALGLVEVLARHSPNPIHLSWSDSAIACATIHGIAQPDTLIQCVRSALHTTAQENDPLWARPAEGRHPDKTLTYMRLTDAHTILEMLSPLDPVGWRWSGWFSEWPHKEGRKIKNSDDAKYTAVSPSHLIGLSDSLHKMSFTLIKSLVAATWNHVQVHPDAISEALWGPWQFTDYLSTKAEGQGGGLNAASFGWGEKTQADWAYTAKNPTDLRKNTVFVPLWLAIEGLSLFPTWRSSLDIHTIGFDRVSDSPHKNNQNQLLMPLWSPPLSRDSIRALLMTIDGQAAHQAVWHRRGVYRLWGSDVTQYNSNRQLRFPHVIW